MGGATTINYKLQEQVLREVFAPPRRATHRHGRRMERNSPIHQQKDISPLDGTLTEGHQRRPTPMQSFPNLKKADDDKSGHTSPLDLRKVATNAIPQKDVSEPELRRRYSSGNLFEQAHTSDTEDNAPFPMDEDEGKVKRSDVFTYEEARQNWAERCYNIERRKKGEAKWQNAGSHDGRGPTSGNNVNREEPHTRTEWFLLIENLTKNMLRPCVLDLKMGTRQYGYLPSPLPGSEISLIVEYIPVLRNEPLNGESTAPSLNRLNFDNRCAKTTSHALGVRICGMQVWDAQSKTYIFQDKYFGRDLKAGNDFKSALTRYITSTEGGEPHVLAYHIPTIIGKITQLGVSSQIFNSY